MGECLPGATFALSSLALAPSLSSPSEVPQSRPHWTANLLPCKARVGGMATSPLPSRGSPIEGDNQKCLHHPCLPGGRLFGDGGQNQARLRNGQKKMPGALTLPPWTTLSCVLLVCCPWSLCNAVEGVAYGTHTGLGSKGQGAGVRIGHPNYAHPAEWKVGLLSRNFDEQALEEIDKIS